MFAFVTGMCRLTTKTGCRNKVGASTIAGLDWWTGPVDWTGLDWTGLDWTGMDWTGLEWTGLKAVI